MKRIVYERDLREQEIKPAATLKQYRSLITDELIRALQDVALSPAEGCPVCESQQWSPAFERSPLVYGECGACGALYASPAPPNTWLTNFYRGSAAAAFWREAIWLPTREARREKIYRPLAGWVLDTLDRYRPGTREGIDIGYHSELLIEELLDARGPLERLVAAGPLADVEASNLPHHTSVTVRPTPLADLASAGSYDAVLAFDVIPRLTDLNELLEGAGAVLCRGGLLLASATCISGFDLQVLWDRAPNIYPPDRMTLPTPEGLVRALERHGFQVLEFSTPGALDVSNVKEFAAESGDPDLPRFLRYLLKKREDEALHDLQEYLQRHRLSSYARVTARRLA